MLTFGFLKGYGIRLSSARIGNREGEASVTGIRPISIIGRFPVHGFVRAFYRSPSFMVPFRQVLASLCPKGWASSVRVFIDWAALGFKGIALTKVKVTP